MYGAFSTVAFENDQVVCQLISFRSEHELVRVFSVAEVVPAVEPEGTGPSSPEKLVAAKVEPRGSYDPTQALMLSFLPHESAIPFFTVICHYDHYIMALYDFK